jgi:hypothetical protein
VVDILYNPKGKTMTIQSLTPASIPKQGQAGNDPQDGQHWPDTEEASHAGLHIFIILVSGESIDEEHPQGHTNPIPGNPGQKG